MTGARVVLISAPPRRARALARGLVEARLAACVTVVTHAQSHYRWKGKMERAAESLLLCKTRAALVRRLEAFVRKNHPYAVPEILALPVAFGHRPYLNWLARETR